MLGWSGEDPFQLQDGPLEAAMRELGDQEAGHVHDYGPQAQRPELPQAGYQRGGVLSKEAIPDVEDEEMDYVEAIAQVAAPAQGSQAHQGR
jgi:hypothetical protein